MIKEANIISLKDFRLYTSKYINKVRSGQTFTVLKKNEPVFTISLPALYDLSNIPAMTKEEKEDMKKSKTAISFKKEGGIKIEDLIKSIQKHKKDGR